jgi:ABC-type polysaccharide/polyol phosphate export permease
VPSTWPALCSRTDRLRTALAQGNVVAYPIDGVGGRLAPILALNPMTHFIDAYRAVLLYGRLPAAGPFAATAAFSLAVFFGAWYVFHKAEFALAENI